MSARLPQYFSERNFSHTYEVRTTSVAALIPVSHVLDDCEANNQRLATREEVEALLECDLESDCIIVIEQHEQSIDLYAADVRPGNEKPTLFYVGRFPKTEAMLPSAAGYILCEKKDKRGNPILTPAFS